MAITYKVLGQINPTANIATTLYTVPSGVSSLISTILVCNQANVSAKFILSIQPMGTAVTSKNYLTYNTTIAANDTIPMTLGLTLATTDVLSAAASTSNVSFGAFGIETTIDSDIPVISAVTITNSSYAALSAIQVLTSGGYVKLIGSGFSANNTVYVNSVAAISTTYVSTTEIRAQVPAASEGTQSLTVFNSNGRGYRYAPGLPYSSSPI
jgi:hypothetical protein